MTGFSGVDAKLHRVSEHIDQLDSAVNAFVNSDTEADGLIKIHLEPPGRGEVLFEVPAQWPNTWSVLLGDALHNLRSSLDHTMWTLCSRSGTVDEPRLVEFPIFDDESAFRRSRKWKYCSDRLTADQRAFIFSLQPIPGGEPFDGRAWLWLLHHLSNIDKHRHINPTGLVLRDLTFEAPESGLPVTITKKKSLTHRLEGTEPIVSFTFPNRLGRVRVKCTFVVDVEIESVRGVAEYGHGREITAIEMLRWMLEFVRDTVVSDLRHG